jgi:hypothetical protein
MDFTDSHILPAEAGSHGNQDTGSHILPAEAGSHAPRRLVHAGAAAAPRAAAKTDASICAVSLPVLVF